MSLQTKEVVIDDSLSQPTQTLLEQLKVLMSDQPEVMPSAEVSYVSQDLHTVRLFHVALLSSCFL
mgnify:CR=1 FL=1